ncbi:uncharacterized protein DSM5745_05146 [Aspergillus mulundensis]|uniref:Uncharacterized protein n=1 Tax=Aspergillus mulundensis TaxID=1810919 RepID=A0A3D8S5M1_9EURO|nr:hypothetical protein DSM5745_05146 [Aspergillus mulundensis]RDW81589.1 hypothetical protein DSM5745_05146 [Aspergillus mulundensis]
MPSLERLPNELILMIAEQTNSQSDLFALTLTNKHFSSLLLPKQIKLNAKFHRATGLTWAIQHDNIELVEEFINAGANLNEPVFKQPDQEYPCAAPIALCLSGKIYPPLYQTVRFSTMDIMELLLDAGADPSLMEPYQLRSTYTWVCAFGKTSVCVAIIKAMVKHGEDAESLVQLTLSYRSNRPYRLAADDEATVFRRAVLGEESCDTGN